MKVEFLKDVYNRFNARDMETVLAAMHENVMWANGMEGGHVQAATGCAITGHANGPWSIPTSNRSDFPKGPQDEVIVEVHQVVHDLNGGLLMDQMVGHIFTIEDGLIRRFDIRDA